MRKIFRYISFALVALTCLSLLCSCSGSREIPAGKLALTKVGEVGDRDVLYEEYYFLANSYLDSAKEYFDGSESELREHVSSLVKENIITNHAILTLCEQEGVEYDESEIKDAVQKTIEDMITTDFGNRDTYIEALDDSYMTDHYVRFVTEVDLIYSLLPLTLAENGKISTNEDSIKEYVKDNFVRTWHIMIANDKNDDPAENLAKANAALDSLENGDSTMYKLIGSAINEDVSMPTNGYCFAAGTMDSVYEDAAFALEVGEYSEVILAKGENGMGEYLDCYYIMQRLEIDDDYIDANYDAIIEEYSNSIINTELEKLKSELEFKPNEFEKSLDILSLEKPQPGFDWLPVIIIGGGVLVLGAVSVAVILIVKGKKKKILANKKAK